MHEIGKYVRYVEYIDVEVDVRIFLTADSHKLYETSNATNRHLLQLKPTITQLRKKRAIPRPSQHSFFLQYTMYRATCIYVLKRTV